MIKSQYKPKRVRDGRQTGDTQPNINLFSWYGRKEAKKELLPKYPVSLCVMVSRAENLYLYSHTLGI